MKKNRSKKESFEGLHSRVKDILKRLRRAYPEARTALTHSNPLELLIATILSAQCTDERVNIVTKDLFTQYSSAQDFAAAKPPELEQVIRSTGFYRVKAKNVINCCKMLIGKFDGEVPQTMKELVQLPGVGRKTANVILGNVFGKIEGIVVDTHVKRLSRRLGFSRESDPGKIESDLMNITPKKNWIATGNLLILHGRKTCQARKPNCRECQLNDLCPSAELFLTSKA